MLVVHETPLEFDLTKHLFSFLLELQHLLYLF